MPDEVTPQDFDHHVEFFVEVRVPGDLHTEHEWEEKIAVLETALYHIALDNLEAEDPDLLHTRVEVHRAPVPKDGPDHWEGVL